MRKTYNDGPNAEERALEQWSSVFIEKLESMKGNTKWQQPWFSEKALSWPQNLSGRNYNAGNAILLMMLAEKNKYELPIWGTFQRFTSLNYQSDKTQGPIPLRDSDGKEYPRVMINKGEKSASVFLTSYTVVDKETKEKIPYETYREMDSEEKAKYQVYPKTHVYSVFNVCQTNLKEARPELYAKLQEMGNASKRERDTSISKFPVFDKMVDEQRWVCPIDVAHRDASYYSISRDSIFMPERAQFKDDESYIGTLSHEAMHSLGAADRFNRFNPPSGFDEKARAREEIIAELGAALVCQKHQALKYIKTDSQPYIKSWIDAIHESPQFIKTVLADVRKSSSMLIGKIEELQLEMDESKSQTQSRSVAGDSDAQNLGRDNHAKRPIPPQEKQEEEVAAKCGWHR